MHLRSMAQSEADKERGKTDSSCLSDRCERVEQIEELARLAIASTVLHRRRELERTWTQGDGGEIARPRSTSMRGSFPSTWVTRQCLRLLLIARLIVQRFSAENSSV